MTRGVARVLRTLRNGEQGHLDRNRETRIKAGAPKEKERVRESEKLATEFDLLDMDGMGWDGMGTYTVTETVQTNTVICMSIAHRVTRRDKGGCAKIAPPRNVQFGGKEKKAGCITMGWSLTQFVAAGCYFLCERKGAKLTTCYYQDARL